MDGPATGGRRLQGEDVVRREDSRPGVGGPSVGLRGGNDHLLETVEP